MQPYSFSGLERLETLNISHLRLDRIMTGTFLGIGSKSLSLDMSHNYLTYLSVGSFQGSQGSLTELLLTGNPINYVTWGVFEAMPRLIHFHADSERHCLLVPNHVRCHFQTKYKIPCCWMVNNVIVTYFAWPVWSISLVVHALSIVFWSTRSGQNIARFLAVALSLSSCVFGSHTLYVMIINEMYGETFAFYRPFVTDQVHCMGAGFLFYLARHMSLAFQALAGSIRLWAVWKPFEGSGVSLPRYLAVSTGVLILLIASSMIPFGTLGSSVLDISSACLIYPVCHPVPGWQYILAQYITLDVVLHGICACLAFVVISIIKASSHRAHVHVSATKRQAMKRSFLFGILQLSSLLASLAVQILAVTMEFWEQEMIAASLLFTLQSWISPVFFPFSLKSFRDWILRR